MSSGVFYLDEDRNRDPSPTSSPRASSPTVETRRPSSPLSTTSSTSQSAPPLPVLPSTQPPLLSPQPQPFGQVLPQHRKHPTPFAATPSFPSPLARAIIVPQHSDTSSSSSHSSPNNSDDDGDEQEGQGIPSPGHSTSSGTPKKGLEQQSRARTASPRTSRSASPASTQKSMSRPPSPTRAHILTPGALLLRFQRSTSGSALAANLPNPALSVGEMPPRPKSTATKDSPSHPGSRRLESISDIDGPASGSSSRSRTGSGGSSSDFGLPLSFGSQAGISPLAFGKPDIYPLAEEARHRRESSGGSPVVEQKDGNILGLGLGWESPSGSASGSSPGSGNIGAKDKGKAKEYIGPPSPRRERERMGPPSGMGISRYAPSRMKGLKNAYFILAPHSPPRQRRPSEFLNPSSPDSRKMPIVVGGRNSFAGTPMASLSTSASMISPLNPLPSPWAAASDSSAFSPPNSQLSELSNSSSASSGGGAMRLNRVPTSVRLAAELIKNPTSNIIQGQAGSSPPPGSFVAPGSALPTPSPLKVGQVSPSRAMPPPALREMGHFASLPTATQRPAASASMDIGKGRPTLSVPGTPVASRSVTPIETRSASGDAPLSTAEALHLPVPGSLPPPSAFKTPLLPTKPRPRPFLSTETGSLAGQFADVPRLHRYRVSVHEATFKPTVLPELTESPASVWSPPPESSSSASTSTSPFGSTRFGLGLNVQRKAADFGAAVDPSGVISARTETSLRQRSTMGQQLQMDLAGVPSLGDAASHASMIMQSRQAKLQRWRPSSAGTQASPVRVTAIDLLIPVPELPWRGFVTAVIQSVDYDGLASNAR